MLARECIRPSVLADACFEEGVRVVTFSSDLVFDGRKASPYTETDPVAPLNEYGRSKAAAEKLLYAGNISACVGHSDERVLQPLRHTYNFVTTALRTLANGHSVRAVVSNFVVSPTFLPDLVTNTLDLLIDGESGIWALGQPRGDHVV